MRTLTGWKRLLDKFACNAPAPDSMIAAMGEKLATRLPEDFEDFLRFSNGGEGLVQSGAYLVIWRVEQLLEKNEAYRAAEHAPGLLLFGSDGADEALAFDLRSEQKPVAVVPFVGMDLRCVWQVAPSFTALLRVPVTAWPPSRRQSARDPLD